MCSFNIGNDVHEMEVENIPVIQVNSSLQEITVSDIGNSFNISLPFEVPAQVEQNSIEASLELLPDVEPSYEIVQGGAKRVGTYLLIVNNILI